MGEPSISPLYYINFALLMLVGVVAYFLKRLVRELDDMEAKFVELNTKVAILIDRDRRKRLEDYEKQ